MRALTCLVGWHKWVRRSTPDGDRYMQCVRCGKDAEGGRPHPLSGGV